MEGTAAGIDRTAWTYDRDPIRDPCRAGDRERAVATHGGGPTESAAAREPLLNGALSLRECRFCPRSRGEGPTRRERELLVPCSGHGRSRSGRAGYDHPVGARAGAGVDSRPGRAMGPGVPTAVVGRSASGRGVAAGEPPNQIALGGGALAKTGNTRTAHGRVRAGPRTWRRGCARRRSGRWLREAIRLWRRRKRGSCGTAKSMIKETSLPPGD